MSFKPFVLHGVGTMFINDTEGKIAKFGALQDLSFDFNVSEEKVFGGDGLTAIHSFIKERNVTVSATNAEFSLEYLKITQGAKLSPGGVLVGEDTVIVKDGEATLKDTAIDVSSAIAYIIGEDTVLARVEGTPTVGEFSVATNGELKFDPALDGKQVLVNYLYESSTKKTQSAIIGGDSVPGFVTIRHTSKAVELKDGTKRRIHTVIYKSKCDGKFQVDYNRGTAFAPKMSFEVLDDNRPDGKVISMTDEIL